MSTWKIVVVVIAVLLLIGLPLYFSCTPSGIAAWNRWFHAVKKADDATNYDTLKQVEDTCRAMISSYKSDTLAYNNFINSPNDQKREWAEQAMIRANRTAATYNEYILKNSYVWKGNVPSDILMSLEYIVPEE